LGILGKEGLEDEIVVVILDEIEEGFYTSAHLGTHLGKCIILDE